MTTLVTYPVPSPTSSIPTSSGSGRLLVLACGAIVRELIHVMRLNELSGVEVAALPAALHNRPERIGDEVRKRIRAARGRFDRILVGYADCGTGGALDQVCTEEGVVRLPGAHCYELFAGAATFGGLHDKEPGTFYLTDYLARHVHVLVFRGLGLEEHPELLPMYFGNYRKLIYLAQTDDPDLSTRAEAAAERLGLTYERRFTGLRPLAGTMSTLVGGVGMLVKDPRPGQRGVA